MKLFLLSLAACLPLALPAIAASPSPNIVLIITDDQGYGDISAYGNPILKTPNLDRPHSESVRFLDFHVRPTCPLTRSAVFTGRHEFKPNPKQVTELLRARLL